MADSRYWFARRFPVGHPRNAMAPVTPEGRRVAGTFVAAMAIGAVVGVLLALAGHWISGIAVFVVIAVLAGWYFIHTATARGDRQHTVDDYKAGRVGQ